MPPRKKKATEKMTLTFSPDLDAPAILSEDGIYRYTLLRRWLFGKGRCLFIMLNPSTADAINDDPTIRRCISFSKQWQFRELMVANIFALRATYPADLKAHAAPIGPENNAYIMEAAKRADRIVAAWGVHGSFLGRSAQVIDMLKDKDLLCLGTTKDGQPRHPLMVAYETKLEPVKKVA